MELIRKKGLLLFGVFLSIALSVAFYVILGNGAQKALIEQMLHREQVIARSGSRAIESFLRIHSHSLVSLSQDESIKNKSSGTQEKMNNFFQTWKDTGIAGLIWVDKDGKAVFISSASEPDTTNIDLSDRDYFIWAKNQPPSSKEVFVGKPVTGRLASTIGSVVLPIATPIFSENEFQGVLVSGFYLSQLTDDFINPLKISEKTEIYIIQQDGTIVYAPNKEWVGGNAFTYIDNYPFLGDKLLQNLIRQALNKGQDGNMHVAIPQIQNTSLKRVLVAYSFMRVNNENWLVAVATPTEDALVFIAPFYFRHFSLILISFLVLLAFSVISSKSLGHWAAHRESPEMTKRHLKIQDSPTEPE